MTGGAPAITLMSLFPVKRSTKPERVMTPDGLNLQVVNSETTNQTLLSSHSSHRSETSELMDQTRPRAAVTISPGASVILPMSTCVWRVMVTTG